ncbi:hypothetical protein ABFS83_04G132100 [Erythranthe nasuta]
MASRAFWAAGCFIVTFFFCVVLNPNLSPLPTVSLEQSIGSRLQMLMSKSEVNERQQPWNVKPIKVDNLTNSRSQVYEMYGDIRIHGNSSTIFIEPSIPQHPINFNWTTKPYARLHDDIAMEKVRQFTIIHPVQEKVIPQCNRNFTSPAIIFSSRGYAGNNFHDYTDLLIPLYSTSQQFNKNVIFLVADKSSWWISKYRLVLQNLSNETIIDINNEKDVLCFPRMIVGLKANKELNIDSSESPHISTTDFTKFLRSTYSLDKEFANNDCKKTRPRLLIISRKQSRHLTNEDKIANMSQRLGFEVVVREIGWEVSKMSKFVNSFDVMIGVHGAGITNMVFLPENAVVIQIVPFGVDIVANSYFEEPAKDMKLRYLEYKVSLNESSLFGRYPPDSEVYKNPDGLYDKGKGWPVFRPIYMDNQDVNVDLNRFRNTLLKAVELVCS